ncbi:S9 family peptidase [Vitiosangium sp. GDMCC 1.1324]|uniref:alpha/beta hydrolase family protein n=1 Tax=Vitiosangium sp. (strain GDMCC 1.1324) TaxID=2138576 RepID=UPI000D363F7E|nr:alpha/beta hydrolase [Vitiosangium sp. GDMCC 1.1324]PTL79541.1 alpha/beta hydrolase [Vitiosangium sp. GDMCC 1.1324]
MHRPIWSSSLVLLCLVACATPSSSTAPPSAAASTPESSVANASGSRASELRGPWHGAIEVREQKLLIDVVFTEANGAVQGALDVRQQGLRGLPLEVLRADAQGVTLQSALPTGQAIRFEGTLAPDRITGTFQQGQAKLPFSLARGERVVEARPTRGDGYEDLEVSFENGAIHLAGTLTIPSPAAARPPVAILITGSGPQDRNEEVFGLRVFELLAQALARDGIATLRFDDRGVGQSTGDFLAATTADFATDVEAAIRFLQTRTDVDPTRLGLIGHSEGGLIAPMVAVRNPSVAFIVLLAGPGQPMDALLLSQIDRIGRAEGHPAEQTRREQEVTSQALALLRQGKDLSTLEGALGSLCGERCTTREATAAFVKSERWQMETPWFRFLSAYDPQPTLRKVRCPVLALGGNLDTQVPSDLNLPLLRRALAEAKNPSVAVEEIPRMNHVLQAAKTGAVSEYATLPKTLEPAVARRIGAWLHALPAAR